MDATSMKRAAAARAVAEVQDGAVLGLGTGTTAELAVEALSKRVAQGLRIVGVPTSERTRALAERLGVPLAPAGDWPRLDLVIDGADQVERDSLDLIKGLGGALLREKIVASAARRMMVVVDGSKLVDRLGGRTPLPVEIVAFGWQGTMERLDALGLQPRLRLVAGQPFLSDGGNHIVDCHLGEIADARALEAKLSGIVGVVETGLFLGLASTVVVGNSSGIEVMQR
ncbi:ribose-5-phosphate isomerase RpiA [Reyranella sp.]|jgi:ribose 5-phosphate isomerase A|uniref:ribose-5-phosphate isomerase RpiA n=1 Tax=Reyranella sp. TaxID=1929291 RepID=UPI002F9440D5